MALLYLVVEGNLIYIDLAQAKDRYSYFTHHHFYTRGRQSCYLGITKQQWNLIETFVTTSKIPGQLEDLIALLRAADYLGLNPPYSFKLVILTQDYIRKRGSPTPLSGYPSFNELIYKLTDPKYTSIEDKISPDKKKTSLLYWHDLYHASMLLFQTSKL